MSGSVHDRVRVAIEAGTPRHARGVIAGQLVLLHPGTAGRGTVCSGSLVIRRPLASRPGGGGGDPGCVRHGAMIDLWVRGEARVSPQTFSAAELTRRASEHEHGNGPGILPGAKDSAFAERIRAFAREHATLLAAG